MNKKILYEMTYGSIDADVSLEKEPISPEEIPESTEKYDSYDEAIEIAQQMAEQFGGDIDIYAEKAHPEILNMYEDDMSPGEKLIQYIVDGGID